MAFLTAEQIRKVRIKGSTVLKFDALDGLELRVVKMSSGAQLATQDVQKEVAEGKKSQRDFLIFMLKNSCAKMDGELFTDEDANTVFDLLPLEDVTRVVNEAARLIGSSVKVHVKGNGDVETAAAPLTEAEKK